MVAAAAVAQTLVAVGEITCSQKNPQTKSKKRCRRKRRDGGRRKHSLELEHKKAAPDGGREREIVRNVKGRPAHTGFRFTLSVFKRGIVASPTFSCPSSLLLFLLLLCFLPYVSNDTPM